MLIARLYNMVDFPHTSQRVLAAMLLEYVEVRREQNDSSALFSLLVTHMFAF